jgi:hypothetical protein
VNTFETQGKSSKNSSLVLSIETIMIDTLFQDSLQKIKSHLHENTIQIKQNKNIKHLANFDLPNFENRLPFEIKLSCHSFDNRCFHIFDTCCCIRSIDLSCRFGWWCGGGGGLVISLDLGLLTDAHPWPTLFDFHSVSRMADGVHPWI